jgi:hypothetical protein
MSDKQPVILNSTRTELSYRECLASLLRSLDGEIHPLWLATDDKYQDEALKKADEYLEQWRDKELKKQAYRDRAIRHG